MAKAAAAKDMAVVQQNAGLPGIPDELNGYTGLEGITEESWIIPRIKIVQPTSKEGTAGLLRLNLTGDEFSELSIIVIKANQGRVLWNPDDDAEEDVLCRSYDYLKPDDSIKSPPSPICAKFVPGRGGKQILKQVCPMSIWGKDGERPECDSTYNLLCISVDELLPFWITLSGTSIKPVKRYLSAIALRRVPLWQYSTNLSTKEQPGKKGKYYVAEFLSPKPISPELEQDITGMVISLKDADIKRTFEEEEAQADGSEEGGNGSGGTEPPPDWVTNG